MSEVEYTESDRMGRLILVNQFLYKMKSKPCEKQYYYCVDNCGSSVHLLLGKITSLKEKHHLFYYLFFFLGIFGTTILF